MNRCIALSVASWHVATAATLGGLGSIINTGASTSPASDDRPPFQFTVGEVGRGDDQVQLDAPWAALVRELGAPIQTLDLTPDGHFVHLTLDQPSTISMPSVDEERHRERFESATATFVAVPHFDGDLKVTGHIPGLLWIGHSDLDTAILAIVPDEDQQWTLAAGIIARSDSSKSRIAFDQDDGPSLEKVETRDLASPAEGGSEVPTRPDVLHGGDGLGLLTPKPARQTVGNVAVDVLAVAFNFDTQRIPPATLLARALAGIGAANMAFDNSSTSTHDIDGIGLVLRGLMTFEASSATSTTQNDLNSLRYNAEIQDVAGALGVDIIAGHRNDYTDNCGLALAGPRIICLAG